MKSKANVSLKKAVSIRNKPKAIHFGKFGIAQPLSLPFVCNCLPRIFGEVAINHRF